MFELQFSPVLLALLGVLVVSAAYLLLGFRHYVTSVSRRVKADAERSLPVGVADYPTVSVIVYAEEDAANLEVLLPQLLEQDYPNHYEVIVVNDGAISSTKDVIGRLEQRYSNLYMTFTPMDSRSLSRKKLALTLGIKAARFDVIVHTMGSAQVPSTKWLRSMCRNFVPGTDVVIGYAVPAVPDGIREPWKRLHAFDNVRTSVEYLSWAIAGRPYRGNACNLAYRREVFFANKGFSRSLHLKYGDDDLFVNEVARGGNTAVELSPDSMVLDVETSPAAAFKADRLRYDYTGSRLKTGARIFFSSCSWAWWIMLGSAVAASVAGLPSLLPAIVAVVIVSLSVLAIAFAWRRVSVMLWSRRLFLTVPWFMTWRPFHTLYYKLRSLGHRGSNLTWS